MGKDSTADPSEDESRTPIRRPAYGMLRPSTVTRSKVKRFKLLITVFLGIVTVGIITGSVLYHRSTSNRTNLQSIKERVGRHYLLPADEEPALATIVDKTKVSTELFKQAQNNDRVLIYQKNRIAIVYRPSIDRIIAVGPVAIDTPKNGIQ